MKPKEMEACASVGQTSASPRIKHKLIVSAVNVYSVSHFVIVRFLRQSINTLILIVVACAVEVEMVVVCLSVEYLALQAVDRYWPSSWNPQKS
jgi:hypothetical protein